MTLLAGLLAFIETPVGGALVAAVPDLVTKVIGIWHTNGTITTQDVIDYVASQKSFDSLVPKKA